ncbi:MAG: tRNA-dihydrouridine synthase family protein [Spirochaetales bacterium]|nr:tRNA-dihydrouridine synthase family protein [Spirochaetales bacterium]
MASLTHRALRELVMSFGGCDEYFTEMISAGALVAGGPLEKFYLDSQPKPELVVYQLVGDDTLTIVRAAEIMNRYPSRGIDINMGCSAPFIKKKGGGVAWMLKQDQAVGLIDILKRKSPTTRLSVKMRLGVQDDPEDLLQFCKRLKSAGLDRITLHPRTANQKFKRRARWGAVQELKESIELEVIGNGDIGTFIELKEKSQGPWDGVMVGRAAVQQPWIFLWAQNLAESRLSVDLEETDLKFLHLLEIHQPKEFFISRALLFFSYFAHNVIWHHNLYTQLQKCTTRKEIEYLWREYFVDNPEERIKLRPETSE